MDHFAEPSEEEEEGEDVNWCGGGEVPHVTTTTSDHGTYPLLFLKSMDSNLSVLFRRLKMKFKVFEVLFFYLKDFNCISKKQLTVIEDSQSLQ